MKLLYYPGCSLGGTATAYDESTRIVCHALGIELQELQDWSCCGAKSAESVSGTLAIEMPAHDLTTAERVGADVVTPCPACQQRLSRARSAMLAEPDRYSPGYRGDSQVRHLLKLLGDNAMLERIKGMVVKKYGAIKPVCYYGCLTTRPPSVTGYMDFEDPGDLDGILTAIGLEPLRWSYKVDCCGGGHNLPRPDIVRQLSARLFDGAIEAGANCLVTCCPMCQVNLDVRQKEVAALSGKSINLPVFFFTELVALAMGQADAVRWWPTHMVDPTALLAEADPSGAEDVPTTVSGQAAGNEAQKVQTHA